MRHQSYCRRRTRNVAVTVTVSQFLHRLFHMVWSTGKVLSSLLITRRHNHCSSCRPITLLSVAGKVFAHVFRARRQPLLHRNCRPHQSRFTKSRSTLDAIIALRLLSELHSEFQKPLQAAFVDLKAAFDSVGRAVIWLALKWKDFITHVIEVD